MQGIYLTKEKKRKEQNIVSIHVNFFKIIANQWTLANTYSIMKDMKQIIMERLMKNDKSYFQQ